MCQADFQASGVFPDPDVDHSPETVYAVGAVLFDFLSSLPDPPIPHTAFKSFVNCATIPNSSVEDSFESSPSPSVRGSASGSASASAAASPMLKQAIDHAHLHAVERAECRSPRCRMYRQLFDALPYAHRSLLGELLPFLARLCGLWETSDGTSPIAVGHVYAMATSIGTAILRCAHCLLLRCVSRAASR